MQCHNWSEIVLIDKIPRFKKVDSRPQKKNVWDIAEDQDWSTFQKSVIDNLASHNFHELSEDKLASRFATIQNSAGVSSLGYK